jgi:hypothetical protein
MTDRQLALDAVSEAQRILEEYLEPRPHDNERLLDRLSRCSRGPSSLSPSIVSSMATTGDVR